MNEWSGLSGEWSVVVKTESTITLAGAWPGAGVMYATPVHVFYIMRAWQWKIVLSSQDHAAWN